MKILCFDDNADGKAYMTEVNDSFQFCLSFTYLLPYLQSHDHVIIAADNTYYKYGDADLSTYLPHGIVLEAGTRVNVNKL